MVSLSNPCGQALRTTLRQAQGDTPNSVISSSEAADFKTQQM